MGSTGPQPALFRDREPIIEVGNAVAEVACPCGGRAPRYYHGALYHLHRCTTCGRDLELRRCCGAALPAAPAVREWRSHDICPSCGATPPEPEPYIPIEGTSEFVVFHE